MILYDSIYISTTAGPGARGWRASHSAASGQRIGMLAALALLLPMVGAIDATPTFHQPSLVGSSNYTHFWMPEPLFHAAAATDGSTMGEDEAAVPPPLYVGIALHGDSGPWGKCPNPKHPQKCSTLYRSLDDSLAHWAPGNVGELPANALIQPTANNTSRGFSGKVVIDPSTNTTGTVGWKEWHWAANTGVKLVGGTGKAAVTGLPPVFGASLVLLPSSVRLNDGSWLTVAYGATQLDHAAGSGNRTCIGLFHWQAHFCVSVFVLASVDEGRSWRYRSSLHWHPSMGSSVGGTYIAQT